MPWLIAATAASVLVCVAVTFLVVRAIFPPGEPVPTIPWGTLSPTANLTAPVTQASTTMTPGCVPNAEYVEDVTVPDDTILSPGATFLKAWRVLNSGTCPWVAGYALRFSAGDQMGGASSISIPSAQPGEIAELSVSLVAPPDPGTYRGDWQLCVGDATCFGPSLYVQIVVEAAAVISTTPDEIATPTTAQMTTIPEPSASPLPPNPGASEWLINGSRALGVREIAWDTALNGFASGKDEIYLSLYIVGIPTGDNSTVFSPLEIMVIDGDGETHETLILERKDPPYALCTASPGNTCEGWWTTTIPDRNQARRTLILHWEPNLLSTPLETPIWQ